MNRLARILSTAGLVFGLALAGAPAWAAQPSPAAIAAAKEILTMKNASSQYGLVIPNIVMRTRDVLFQSHLNYAQDLNEVAVIIKKEFAGREQEIGDGWATVYATVFTEQELKDLVAFFKSPLGQKWLVGEPRATAECVGWLEQWEQALMETVKTQFQIEMHKRDKDL
jgi:hypothetical protein